MDTLFVAMGAQTSLWRAYTRLWKPMARLWRAKFTLWEISMGLWDPIYKGLKKHTQLKRTKTTSLARFFMPYVFLKEFTLIKYDIYQYYKTCLLLELFVFNIN